MSGKELALRISRKNSDGEYWLHIEGLPQRAGFNLGDPVGMIASAVLMAASGHTYVRLDPNTRVVTVDQLNTLMDRAAYAERLHNCDVAGSIAEEILAIIRDAKP